MRTPLASKQTTRARIRDLLCGAHQRTADLVAYVAAQVAADGLSTIDPATFGLLNEAAGTDVGSIAAGTKVWTSPDDPWTAADVGKVAHVAGAGAAGAVLVTTIASFQAAGQVTLADAASTTVAADVGTAGGLGIWGWVGVVPDVASPILDASGRTLRSAVPLAMLPGVGASRLLWSNTTSVLVSAANVDLLSGAGSKTFTDLSVGTTIKVRVRAGITSANVAGGNVYVRANGSAVGVISVAMLSVGVALMYDIDITIRATGAAGEIGYAAALSLINPTPILAASVPDVLAVNLSGGLTIGVFGSGSGGAAYSVGVLTIERAG